MARYLSLNMIIILQTFIRFAQFIYFKNENYHHKITWRYHRRNKGSTYKNWNRLKNEPLTQNKGWSWTKIANRNNALKSYVWPAVGQVNTTPAYTIERPEEEINYIIYISELINERRLISRNPLKKHHLLELANVSFTTNRTNPMTFEGCELFFRYFFVFS